MDLAARPTHPQRTAIAVRAHRSIRAVDGAYDPAHRTSEHTHAAVTEAAIALGYPPPPPYVPQLPRGHLEIVTHTDAHCAICSRPLALSTEARRVFGAELAHLECADGPLGGPRGC